VFLLVVTEVEGDSIVQSSAVEDTFGWTGGYVTAEFSPFNYAQAYLWEVSGKDYEVLNCLIEKESGWKMKWNYMHDVNPSKYTAYGFFQILESTARLVDPELDRMDAIDNIDLGIKIYRQLGIEQWLVWRDCIGFVKD
jgi:hypothetical protein